MLGACSPCCPTNSICVQCCPDKPSQITISVQSEETTGDPRQDPESEWEEEVTCPAIDEEMIFDIEEAVLDSPLDEIVCDGTTGTFTPTIGGQAIPAERLFLNVFQGIGVELFLNGVRFSIVSTDYVFDMPFGRLTISAAGGNITVVPFPRNGDIITGTLLGTCEVSFFSNIESTAIIPPGGVFPFTSHAGEGYVGSASVQGFFSRGCEPGGCLTVRTASGWGGAGFRTANLNTEPCKSGGCNAYAESDTYVSLSHARDQPTVTASVASIAGTAAEFEVTLSREDGDECFVDSGVRKTYWKASATVKKDQEGNLLGGEYYQLTDRVAFETDGIGGPVLTNNTIPRDVVYAINEPAITLLARSGFGASLVPVLTAANDQGYGVFAISDVTVEHGGDGYREGDVVYVECDSRAIVSGTSHPALRVMLADLIEPTVEWSLPVQQYPCLGDVELTPTIRRGTEFGVSAGVPGPRRYILEFAEILQFPKPVVATCQGIPTNTRIPVSVIISDGQIEGSSGSFYIQFDSLGNGRLFGDSSTSIKPTMRGAIEKVVNINPPARGGYRKLSVESVAGEHGEFYKLGSPASCSGFSGWTTLSASAGTEIGQNYTGQAVAGEQGESFSFGLVRVCPTPTVTVTIQ